MRGQKSCLNCQTVTGPRTFVCKNCNTAFPIAAKRSDKSREIISASPARKQKPVSVTKSGKERKRCKECSHCGSRNNGARSAKCTDCSKPFIFKLPQLRKENREERTDPNFDWKTLQPGDRIKVIQGYGPYWKSLGESDDTPMGYYGKFIVKFVDDNGIHAYGNKNESGHCYIWMGQECVTEDGLNKEPHKVVKLKPKPE